MLILGTGVRIFLARDPVDMRKNHDGLIGVTQQVLKQDPMNGHYFVFFNRRRNRVKILAWEEGGFWVFYKRLEGGTFELPAHPDKAGRCIEVAKWQLELIFSGISVKDIKRRRRYHLHERLRKPHPRRSAALVPQG